MEISPLLFIPPGLTALIGAGGKTTLLETLAEELRRKGSVILCTSARIYRPERYEILETDDRSEVTAALRRHGAICVGTPAAENKLSAPQISFSVLTALADYVLVEADGARGLPLKAHERWEPVIPVNAGRTVLVLGMDGMGKPIRMVCHRPALFAALAQTDTDSIVTPELAVRVILAEGFGDCVYLNKTEQERDLQLAKATAEQLPCPVVAGSLWKGEYQCLH